MISKDDDYDLLSATKFDPLLLSLAWNNDNDGPSPFLLLNYHFDRLVSAAEQHGWQRSKAALSFSTLKATCHKAVSNYHAPGNTPYAFKIRLILSQSGNLTADATPAQPFTSDPTALFDPSHDTTLIDPISVVIDVVPTPSSLFTSTKTTYRAVYNDARSRAGLPIVPTANSMTSDVLLYNTQDLITETSVCNVAFYRPPNWITPPTSTGCLPGVFRRWLLEQGRISEAEENTLTKESVREGDWVILLNAVQGCRLGRITTRLTHSVCQTCCPVTHYN